jgi:hypothetical protein
LSRLSRAGSDRRCADVILCRRIRRAQRAKNLVGRVSGMTRTLIWSRPAESPPATQSSYARPPRVEQMRKHDPTRDRLFARRASRSMGFKCCMYLWCLGYWLTAVGLCPVGN